MLTVSATTVTTLAASGDEAPEARAGGTASRPPHGTVADSEFDQEGETGHVRQVEAEPKTSKTRTANV
jgi:hypothetical protein